jgi:GntR family transcriptional regulator, rspAB operon transcriptional repressor
VDRRLVHHRGRQAGTLKTPGLAAAEAVVVRRNTIAEQIHAVMRRDIISGRLAPRTSLAEQELAQRFGVSRTPIREAMIKLSEEGLVEIFPQYGSFVGPIKLAEVLDSQFARETLECAAVEKAVAPMDARQEAKLKAILDRQRALQKRGDDEGFFRADEEMHAFIFALAGHPTAWLFVAGAKAQMDRVRYLAMTDLRKHPTVMAEHAALIDRLCARDRNGAVEAMRIHLRSILKTIEILRGQKNDVFVESGRDPKAPPEVEAAPSRHPVRKRPRKTEPPST